MALKNKNKTKETDTKDSRLQQKLKRRENAHQRPKEYKQIKANEHIPQLLNHTSKSLIIEPHARAIFNKLELRQNPAPKPPEQLSATAPTEATNGWPSPTG